MLVALQNFSLDSKGMVATLEMKGNVYYSNPNVLKQYNSPSLRRPPRTQKMKDVKVPNFPKEMYSTLFECVNSKL